MKDKIHCFSSFVCCLLILLVSAGQAYAQPEIPTSWTYTDTTLDEPVYDSYLGNSGPPNKNQYHYAWGKAVYHKEQKSERGPYKTLVVLIEYTCTDKDSAFRTLREIKYSASGNVISDIHLHHQRTKLHTQARDLGLLPFDEAFAYVAQGMDNSCFGGVQE